MLKSGPDDFFYEDIDISEKQRVINKLIKKSSNSEHILLYQIYKYIEDSPGESIFNLELFKQIEQLYNKQIDKLTDLYDRFKYIIDVSKKDLDTNIIYSFNYGFRDSRAFKSSNKFKYNGMFCDTEKSLVDTNKINSVIFYSNIYLNGKLKISILSPYLLDKDL